MNAEKHNLEDAIQLRSEGRLEESNAQLVSLAIDEPNNPMLLYQCAWSFDVLGQETNAIPYYENAIALGLTGEDLKGAFLGLGSTYRAIGAYANSKAVFQKARNVFPQDNAIKTFYAMTLYNLGEHASAMQLLLAIIAETSADSNVQEYQKAITLYSGDLEKVWG